MKLLSIFMLLNRVTAQMVRSANDCSQISYWTMAGFIKMEK